MEPAMSRLRKMIVRLFDSTFFASKFHTRIATSGSAPGFAYDLAGILYRVDSFRATSWWLVMFLHTQRGTHDYWLL